MTTLSTHPGAELVAHGVHSAIVLAGLWGLAVLLLPGLIGRRAPARPALRTDHHDRRVAELRVSLGASPTTGGTGVTTTVPTTVTGTGTGTGVGRGAVSTLPVPLAVVATCAAAGIHAAVAPAHLQTGGTTTGLLFLLAAAAQAGWVLAALRPGRTVLAAGAVVNGGLLLVWLASRTVGLPAAVMPHSHPIGPWDAVCAAWELTAVVACLLALRTTTVPRPLPPWYLWPSSGRAAAGLAATSLVWLSLSGAPS